MKNSTNVKKRICIILITILIALTSKSYAASDSFKTNLKADKDLVKIGEKITVTIALSDISITSGEKGIGAYTAKLDFDSSALEYVSADGTDNWESPFYQDKLVIGSTNNGEVVKDAQDIGTLTFKIKEGAPLGKTTIKLTNFTGSTAATDVDAKDTEVTITIADENGNTENQSAGETRSAASDSNANGSTDNGEGTSVGKSTNGSQSTGASTNGSESAIGGSEDIEDTINGITNPKENAENKTTNSSSNSIKTDEASSRRNNNFQYSNIYINCNNCFNSNILYS